LTSEVLRGRIDEALRFEIEPHSCFACGELNEHGLQLRMHLAERGSWTEVTLPQRFEGWQGIAHGGILATLVDEAMAWSLFTADQIGLTASLSIDFRRPATVERRLRVEGWITERRRLRFDTAARVIDVESGELLVEATGVYVAAPPSRAREIRERYGLRVEPATAVGAGT
jgi:acyl-coenzyme A thioesterase PaaI-like protein